MTGGTNKYCSRNIESSVHQISYRQTASGEDCESFTFREKAFGQHCEALDMELKEGMPHFLVTLVYRLPENFEERLKSRIQLASGTLAVRTGSRLTNSTFPTSILFSKASYAMNRIPNDASSPFNCEVILQRAHEMRNMCK